MAFSADASGPQRWKKKKWRGTASTSVKVRLQPVPADDAGVILVGPRRSPSPSSPSTATCRRCARRIRRPPESVELAPRALLLDGASIYWTVGPAVFPGGEVGFGRLYRVPKDGSTPATVLVDGLSEPAGMFVDGPFLYWSEYASGAARGRVMRTLKPL